MRDLSQVPKHVHEFAHFRATFPLPLWIAATVAACLLAFASPNPIEDDLTAAASEPAPVVSAPLGRSEPVNTHAD
jgi:hypothetical protein